MEPDLYRAQPTETVQSGEGVGRGAAAPRPTSSAPICGHRQSRPSRATYEAGASTLPRKRSQRALKGDFEGLWSNAQQAPRWLEMQVAWCAMRIGEAISTSEWTDAT